jgi:hypothetical protein
MRKTILVLLLTVMFASALAACQSAPTPAKPATAPAAPPAVQPVIPPPVPTQVPPPAPTTPAVQPVPQVPLQVSVEMEGGRRSIPVGMMYNIKYSTNRSANLTMFSTLPNGQVIEFFTLEIGKPDTYIFQSKDDRPIGERTITIKAVGIDGQTATASCKYWAGSIIGDKESP